MLTAALAVLVDAMNTIGCNESFSMHLLVLVERFVTISVFDLLE